MPRIDKDPSEETCPDYRGKVYEDERLLLIGDAEIPAMTEDEAAEKLEKMWQIKHQRQVTACRQCHGEDEWDNEPGMQPEQWQDRQLTSEDCQEEPQGYVNARRQSKNTYPETNRKKSFTYNLNQGISTIPVNRPAQYAIDKLNAQIYVELDYFTLWGCTMVKNC
ncbi:hypothetical protein BDQ17DRAFT_1255603 [Cyathus striatus]|nr:hypothetical protein BDQ17DRAFT_1255603 [Cyathus striatus]